MTLVLRQTRRGLLILGALVLAPSGLSAQGMKASSPIELARTAASLKAGEWVWAPAVAPSGPVMIYVDLSHQVATIYRNGVRIGVSTISSGKKGYETPTGVFTILQKDIDHHSNLYENASMPFQQRLTWDGVALHAGGLPGYPESHGCIHLPYGLAKELFKVTKLGATVIVDEGNSVPMPIAGGNLLLPTNSMTPGTADSIQGPNADDYDWHPEKSLTGPITIILSRSDQSAVVMRNGVVIGRSKVVMPNIDFGSHILTLTIDKSGKRQWIYVAVPGHADDEGKVLDGSVASQVKFPKPMYDAVSAILQPGTTILVTQSSVDTTTTGEKLVVMNGVK
jgi:hypothetical protein